MEPNYDKEREEFENWVRDVAPHVQCQLHEKDDFGDYEKLSMSWAFFTWRSKQAQINELQQKLAKYENPDYVLVPRKPSKEIAEKMREIIWEHGGFQIHEEFNKIVYTAMIEAVENDN